MSQALSAQSDLDTLQLLRFLRLARLARLVRIMRTIVMFDDLLLTDTALRGSVRILGWSMVVFGMLQVTTALVLHQGIHTIMVLGSRVVSIGTDVHTSIRIRSHPCGRPNVNVCAHGDAADGRSSPAWGGRRV